MKKLSLFLATAMCVFICFSSVGYAEDTDQNTGTVATDQNSGTADGNNQAATDGNDKATADENAEDQNAGNAVDENAEDQNAAVADPQPAGNESEQKREVDERVDNTERSTETTSEDLRENREDGDSFFTLENIILYGSLILLFILSVVNMVLSIMQLKKSGDTEDELIQHIDDKVVKKVSGCASQSDVSYVRNEIQKLSEAVNSINKNMNNANTESTGKPTVTKTDRLSNALNREPRQRKDSCGMYNDYLSNKSSTVPRTFKKIKIGVSGTNPMINENDGIEFYAEEKGSTCDLYPVKAQMSEFAIAMMGSHLFDFAKSGSGNKKVIMPAKVIINPRDGIITVKSKGKAEY